MRLNHQSPFHESNQALPYARQIVRDWVEQEANGKGIERIANDPEAYACWLAGSKLSEYVIRGTVRRCMISRWLAEALANVQARRNRGQEEKHHEVE